MLIILIYENTIVVYKSEIINNQGMVLMKCFYHNDRDAIGICSACHRGLCPECIADVDGNLACKNSCQEKVKSINELLEKDKNSYKKTGSVYKRNAIFCLLTGLLSIFLGMGVGFMTDSFGLMLFVGPLGIIFLIGAYHNYKSSKEISTVD